MPDYSCKRSKMELKAQDILIENGIKPTFLRSRILQYIIDYRSHPSADTIFSSLQQEVSTLSRTSVYNTLKQLASKRIVQSVTGIHGEQRFDIFHVQIGHFHCESCGEISDFELNGDISGQEPLRNYQVNEAQLCVRGLCPKCTASKCNK
jgi:Fur family transcriptional regulator, peroxide stress response regulator